MSLIITAIIAFAVADGAWRWVVIAVGLLWEAAEIAIFLRWRNVKPKVGHETLIGETGKAVTNIASAGQVQVRGQVWSASSDSEIDAGAEVRVTATDGLRLTVEPYDRYGQQPQDANP